MNVVFVGHVDHGKSTLVGRILNDTNSLSQGMIELIKKTCTEEGKEFEYAFILDHMEEERNQGITIDTTQTFFKTQKRDYVIIDAPGHKEFLKNMITGASQAEAAILLVDAKEGVKEQTKRHAYLLSFLGIKQLIIAINKIDLAEYNQEVFEKIKTELLEFLKKLNIFPSHVIPVSAKNGDNVVNRSEKMPWYSELTLLQALDEFTTLQQTENKPLRYSVQDVYKVHDKRIIVGRVESGSFKKGQEVTFLPSQKTTTIKSIECFNETKETACVGECAGLTTEDHLFIERGEVMTSINQLPLVVESLKANIFWMSREPLKMNDSVIIKCGTQTTECNISKIEEKMNSSTLEKLEDSEELKETEVAKVNLTLKSKMVIEKFNEVPELGRFVIIQNGDISAGGIMI